MSEVASSPVDDPDLVLALPRQLEVLGDDLVVLDASPPFVRVFDRRGTLLQSFGGAGSGPGEFSGPMSIEASESHYFVTDGDGGTSQLELDGAFVRAVSIPPGGSGLGLYARGTELLVASSSLKATTVIDLTNSRSEIDLIEWADTLPTRAIFHRSIEGYREGWVSAPRRGPGFFLHDGDGAETFVPFVDPQPVQDGGVRLEGPVHQSARTTMVVGDSIVFLYGGFQGSPGEQPRWLDFYVGAEYQHSVELPLAVIDAEWSDGSYYVLVEDPVPSLLRVRPVS